MTKQPGEDGSHIPVFTVETMEMVCADLAGQRDALGKALGDLLVAIGVVAEGTPLTGPELLLLASDAAALFDGSGGPDDH